MACEIERKFLLADSSWKTDGLRKEYFRQGYIRTTGTPHVTVRIRIADEKAYLTLKGALQKTARSEYEYEIPVDDAQRMLDEYVSSGIVEKYRYFVPAKEGTWEIDEYLGDNEGLVTAELELKSEDAVFTKPAWLGDEVTGVPRYYNSMLATYPWKMWPPSERM